MSDREYEYTEDFIAGLQWMWGDGYLSPGGPEEVAELLAGVDVAGCDVLDIGSGLGAIDVLLAQDYAARSIVGIDIEPPLIDHSVRRAAQAGLADRVRFQLVEPGPLPFAGESFDLVFSKDAIIHIGEKAALYEDVLRVLRPGGAFVGSDWLRGGEGEYSEAAREWLEVIGLTFEMKDARHTEAALSEAGFIDVSLRDRNEWYRREIKNELATLSGDNYPGLVERLGADKAARRVQSTTLKKVVVDNGELRPTHFIGYKPA